MTGYRVATEAPDEPLAIDEALCRTQRFKQRLLVHVVITVLTASLWLPGLLDWLARSPGSARRWAQGYRVQISGGGL